jgi:hypothetical protein
MVITTQPTAPLTSGGLFQQQPVLTLKDRFNNTCTNNSTTEISVGISGGMGSWTVSGTTPRTAVNGIVTFDDLTATNTTLADVTNASLLFNSAGLSSVTSNTMTIPVPAG